MKTLNSGRLHWWPRCRFIANCCLVLALSVTGPAFAESAANQSTGWTTELSMQLESVSGTAISSDAKYIAYVVKEALMDGEQSEYLSHIWLSAADGSSNVQFTRGKKSAHSPAFSPNGKYLTFLSARGDGGQTELWIMPVTGGEARQLTKSESGIKSYKWSPNGERIALVMTMPLTKEEKKRNSEKRDVILVEQQFRYDHLYVIAVDVNEEEQQAPVALIDGDTHVVSFDWSPDGSEIVYGHSLEPTINDFAMTSGDISVVTVPSAGDIREYIARQKDTENNDKNGDEEKAPTTGLKLLGSTRLLLGGRGQEGNPLWSPDGKWIAYTSSGDRPEPIGLRDLYIIPAKGGQERRLAETPNRSVNMLAWDGNSKEIFLLESVGTQSYVIAVPIKGDKIRHLSVGSGVVGATAIAASKNVMAFSWEDTERPWDLYTSSTKSFRAKKITDFHKDMVLPEMGKTELLSWNAPDGTPVEGLLTYPVGYKKGQSYPLILNVHGGPAGVFSQRFTGGSSIYMIQYFAQNGFAVLRPNPRGSTGYGKEFRYANFRDWGYGDLSDLLAGMDKVIAMGVGDADKQLLMGWSYGGYMTSFAVTQTDRFKAASMGAGLSNLVSMVTTTDVYNYLRAHMGGDYWDEMATYQKHSAVYHIQNVVTPTQVLHGTGDLRVPYGQGLEFYRSLKLRDVDTELVAYPRSGHGPSEPKLLKDVSERILTWFRKYVPE